MVQNRKVDPNFKEPVFDAPIPGLHMTSELGSFPWQSPPQFTTIDEVIEHYTERMSSEEFNDQLVEVMEMGVPLTTMANSIQLSGVMEGKHTVDTGILVKPILIEMMRLIGDSAKIKYDTGLENPEKGRIRESLLGSLKEKLKAKEQKNSKTKEEDIVEEEEEKPKGLMARRDQ